MWNTFHNCMFLISWKMSDDCLCSVSYTTHTYNRHLIWRRSWIISAVQNMAVQTNLNSGPTLVVKHFCSLLHTHHFLHDRLQVVSICQQHSPCISSKGSSQQWDRHWGVLCVRHLHRTRGWQGLLTGPIGTDRPWAWQGIQGRIKCVWWDLIFSNRI